MSTVKEAKANYLSEWLNLSIALRSASDSATAYVNKLKEEGKDPKTLELPIFIVNIDAAKKRKAEDDDDGDKTKGKRGSKKKVKDPNAPKRPPSAYINFQNSIRQETRDANKDMPYPEVMKIIGERWNKLSEEDKKPWNEEADAKMKEYKIAEEQYKAGGGKVDTPSPAPGQPAPKTEKKTKKEQKPVKAAAPPPAEESEEEESSDEEPASKKAPAQAVSSDETESESEEEPPVQAPPAKKQKVASPVKASTIKSKSEASSKTSKPESKAPKPKESSKAESSKPSSSKDKDKKKDKKRKSAAAE